MGVPSTHSIDFFSTSNGIQISKVKKYGKNLVPFGCYYDDAEMIQPFLKRLNDDILPLVSIIEKKICECFDVNPEMIKYSGWLDRQGRMLDGTERTISQLSEIKILCEEYIKRWGAEDFSFYLDIEILKEDNWGTQLNLYSDKNIWNDVEGIEEYPVRVIRFCNICEPVDNEISNAMLANSIEYVIADLKRCYDLNHSHGM